MKPTAKESVSSLNNVSNSRYTPGLVFFIFFNPSEVLDLVFTFGAWFAEEVEGAESRLGLDVNVGDADVDATFKSSVVPAARVFFLCEFILRILVLRLSKLQMETSERSAESSSESTSKSMLKGWYRGAEELGGEGGGMRGINGSWRAGVVSNIWKKTFASLSHEGTSVNSHNGWLGRVGGAGACFLLFDEWLEGLDLFFLLVWVVCSSTELSLWGDASLLCKVSFAFLEVSSVCYNRKKTDYSVIENFILYYLHFTWLV